MEEGIRRLNSLSRREAEAALLQCGGSSRWAREVAAHGPFRDREELFNTATDHWLLLDDEDWLEAFSRHPRIGGRKAAAGQTKKERAWSSQEQSGMRAADEAARAELAELNRRYEEKFGYTFIICATGKTPAEILAALRTRLGNDPDVELRAASREQWQIMKLRLLKFLEPRWPR